jgi:tetratricopeptide (TPR) repeat protein
MAEDLKKESEGKTVTKTANLLQENESIQQVAGFFRKYQMYIGIAIAAVLLFILYKQFFGTKQNPAKEMAAERALQNPMFHMSRDSFDIALNGDSTGEGFLKIISKNKGTKIANQARMEAAICYLKTNRPKEAVKMLEEAGGFGKQINARRLSLLGDAKSDIGTENGVINKKICEEAIGYYEKAAGSFSDDDLSAAYLLKSGELYIKIGDLAAAKKVFINLREKYPDFQQMGQVDKELGRLGVEN